MKNKQQTWLSKPKSLTEKGYRKFMAKTKKVTITTCNGDLGVTLQSVSPSWYYDINDKYGMTSRGRKQSSKYLDELFKNCVVFPGEIRNNGIKYFDDSDDIVGAEELSKEIESFLRERKESRQSEAAGENTGTSVADGLSK